MRKTIARCEQEITEITAERDALRKLTVDLRGENQTLKARIEKLEKANVRGSTAGELLIKLISNEDF